MIRQKDSLFLGCVAVFVALFVLNYIDYIKKVQENDYVEWDIKTITAGDYTIEFDITVDFYRDWLDNKSSEWIAQKEAEGVKYTAMVEAFRDWIQLEMEQRLD